MKRFFLFCSGANVDVLNHCPTDESKYAGIGVTILLTAVLAALSGAYALFTVFHSAFAAIAFGLLWGAVIFNLDRVIVSGMRKQSHFGWDLVYAVPRFGISLLLAIVISRPLELKLFEPEIRDKWAEMQIVGRSRDVETIQASDGARLAALRDENARLLREVEAKRGDYNARNTAWIQEKEGTAGTGIPGAGPVFAEKDEVRREAERQMKEVEARNLPLIEQNTREMLLLRGEQQRTIARTDTVRTSADGFLARMEAFGELARESTTVYWASIFITILFMSLETAPVMVKLLSTLTPLRPYDEMLQERETELVEAARQKVRVRKHELKEDAERMMSDFDDATATERRLAANRTQLRQEAELHANAALMAQISGAQLELAGRLVEEWKKMQIQKIENDVGAFVEDVP